ncbi:MAG: hypothetical protein KAS93_00665 [Gammaproteobacteria bacterium]|nr:hypothetical protein [Gammaproteobacteria bacterium]
MGNITVRESISQLQQLMCEAEELRLAIIHNLHQFIEFDPALAIDIRAAYKPQNDKLIERVKSVAGAQEYARVQKHFAGQHVLLTTMQEDLEILQSLVDHIGNVVTKLSNSNVVSNKEHAAIMQELATRWEKIICPHDDPVKVREYSARGGNVDITDYCGISDFTSEVVFHEIRLQKIEVALQAQEEFNKPPTTHPVTQQATVNVDDAVFAEVDKIAQEVAGFAFGRYGSQFALYEKLIHQATSKKRVNKLVNELTRSNIKLPQVVNACGGIVAYENPWFKSLGDLALNKSNLMQLERELLAHQEQVQDNKEVLVKVNFALQQVRSDLAQLNSNRFKKLLKQSREISGWAAKHKDGKPGANMLRKIFATSDKSFRLQLRHAETNGYEQMLRNNYVRHLGVVNDYFMPQFSRLQAEADKHHVSAEKLNLDKFRDPMLAANSTDELVAIKTAISAEQAQFGNLYDLRARMTDSAELAICWMGLNTGIIAEIQERLFYCVESIAPDDAEKAERIANLILSLGGYADARSYTAWGRAQETVEKELNTVYGNVKNKSLFQKSVNRYLDTLSNAGVADAEFSQKISEVQTHLKTSDDSNYETYKQLQVLASEHGRLCRKENAHTVPQLVALMEHILGGHDIVNAELVAAVRALRSYYVDAQDGFEPQNMQTIEGVYSLFNVDSKYAAEPKISAVALTMSKLDQLAREADAYIAIAHQVTAANEVLKQRLNLDSVNFAPVKVDAAIQLIKNMKSAHNARELFSALSADMVLCEHNINVLNERIDALNTHLETIGAVKALPFEQKCNDVKGNLVPAITELRAKLQQEQTVQHELHERLTSATELKQQLCFDAMPWSRRVMKAWTFGVKNPRVVLANARKHPVKVGATLLGLAAVGVLTAKIALPIAAIGIAAKIATTAKVATILIGDAAIASASLANSVEEISDKMSEVSSVEQQAKNSAGALDSHCHSSVASEIADEDYDSEKGIAPALTT